MTTRQRRIAAALAAVPLIVVAHAGTASAAGHGNGQDKHSLSSSYATSSPTANPYAPSGVGSGTPQGNGNAPANGTVGNADNKNPPGQAPNGSDHNNGYECDGNHGVGDKGGNPAHSGCTSSFPKPSPSPSKSWITPPPEPPHPVLCKNLSICTPPTTPPPHIIVCSVGPCQHGAKPQCTKQLPGNNPQGRCLPYTGVNTGYIAAVGGEALLGGLLLLLLLNLESQVRKYRRM